jgi:nucleoid DNA-binding protein
VDAVTKKEMVRQIATEFQTDQTLVKKIVQRSLDSIVDAFATTGRIELRNFGVFEVKNRAARKARNPRTNQEVVVPPKRVVTFQAGKNVAKLLVEPVGCSAAASLS